MESRVRFGYPGILREFPGILSPTLQHRPRSVTDCRTGPEGGTNDGEKESGHEETRGTKIGNHEIVCHEKDGIRPRHEEENGFRKKKTGRRGCPQNVGKEEKETGREISCKEESGRRKEEDREKTGCQNPHGQAAF